MATIDQLEATGDSFVPDRLMDVRARTRRAVLSIADKIEVGMTEEDATRMARDVLTGMGMRRGWHRTIVRFGPNTTKDFSERSEPGVVLGERDIYYVDIGPIYQGYEGDGGDTFVVGDDPEHERARRDVHTIWGRVRQHWLDEHATGRELYDRAGVEAERLGWRLNLDVSGHRLSDFPHAAHYGGSIAELPMMLRPDRWVLEIAIIHPDRPFGAFYEDLLLDDQSVSPFALSPS